MRQEMKFRRGSGLDWKPGFLYLIPGLSSFLNSVDDVRLCIRTIYADVAVFVVLFVTLRSLEPFMYTSVAEQEL